MKTYNFGAVLCFFSLLLLTSGCEESLKGTLKIAITDAPIDADQVKAVNIVITNVEGYQNGSWKSIKNFEQPTSVNLLSLTGGKSTLLIDQFTNPGEFTSVKMSLNMAIRNSSLIVSPQSNIVFKDGSTTPLYLGDGALPEVIIDHPVGISSRGITDLTFDFDLRKSIRVSQQGEYILDPVIRVIETRNSGHLSLKINNTVIPERMFVYAYSQGSFNGGEFTTTSDRLPFFNAITSSKATEKSIVLGFLPVGAYDLVFVSHDATGNPTEILGRKNNINIVAGEPNNVDIDIDHLSPS